MIGWLDGWMEGSLTGYRALDLTDETGYFCGKILGDLGSDVLKVERPEGDRGRRIGPFYQDVANKEKSLFWLAHNASKRGITLNIETEDGKSLLTELIKRSDFVIESFMPGKLEELGLSYPYMSEINPRLVVVSITPFGQTGPYSQFKASDIISMGMGGLLFITGYPDRPPVRIGIPQVCCLAGAHATVGALTAHYYREKTGIGQQVDVSVQEAVTRVLFMEPLFWDFEKQIIHREGHHVRRGKLKQRELWECKDGLVFFRIMGGPFGRRNRGLVEWIREEEGNAGVLDEVDWDHLDLSKVTQEQLDSWEEHIGRFLKTQVRSRIKTEALQRNVTIMFPVQTFREMAEDEQLAERDYWVDLDYPHISARIRYPGAFCKMGLTPLQTGPAPRVGQHNREIYIEELGLSQAEYIMLREAGVI